MNHPFFNETKQNTLCPLTFEYGYTFKLITIICSSIAFLLISFFLILYVVPHSDQAVKVLGVGQVRLGPLLTSEVVDMYSKPGTGKTGIALHGGVCSL